MKKVLAIFHMLALLLAVGARAAESRQVITGHVPEAVARLKLQPIGSLPATNILRLAIGVNGGRSRDLGAAPNFHGVTP